MTSDHMTPDEFRRRGAEVIDWLARYMESVENQRIVPSVVPGEIYRSLPERAPEEPEPFDHLLKDLDDLVMPGMVHWQSPGWFAFFPANTSGPSVLGELAAAGLAQQGMNWATSPVCTEIEMRVLDWLVDLMGLPQSWKMKGPGGGVIQMSASDATHVALVVAREQARARGASIDDQVVYGSAQAHSSIEKGAKIAGFVNVRLIDTDDAYALDVAALRRAVDADVDAGLYPAVVVSSLGTTGTSAVDPIRKIGEMAGEFSMWHHVDAAFAGSAMICEEFRHHQDGLEHVDSYVFNPHKWMFTNFDCSVFYVSDRRPLIDTMSITSPFFPASDSDDVVDYRDWHVSLGRRFRALKLWWVLRCYGAEGIRRHIREHIRLAQILAARLNDDARFETVAPTPFSLVCFRHVDGDEATDALVTSLNDSGEIYLTPTTLDDRRVIRVSIGQSHTEERHVDRLWELIDSMAWACEARQEV